MKRIMVIFALLLSCGLLISSQALAVSEANAENEALVARTAPKVLNQEQVSEMQRLLNNQGYTVAGMLSGVLTEETRVAIRQFQDAKGLTLTGHPNEETLRALAPSSTQQEFFGLSPEFGEIPK